MAKKICIKCGHQMEETNFYTYKNGQKFQLCKTCLTLHVDNFDPSTFLWILQKADVPYIPQEWDSIRDKAYAKAPNKMNGMSVVGKYFSKMKLKQFKSYGWADSQRIQQERRKAMQLKKTQAEIIEKQARQRLEKGQINEAQFRTLTNSAYQKQHEAEISDIVAATAPITPSIVDPIGIDNMFNENYFMKQQQLPQLDDELTKEDKQYLAMKWGRTYRVNQWIQLQKNYNDMMQSFDIQDADSKTALIFICKTTLKMNQALDCGDLEGYQKLSRVYDSLRKSAKFTAAQNKEDKPDFIDSVGQLVSYCQKYGHKIPRFEVQIPYDKVDQIIQDQKDYLRTLVYEDSALARQIQDYLKEVKIAADRKKDKDQAKAQGYDAPQLTQQDTLAFKDFIKQEKDKTQEQMKGEKEDELTDNT